MLKYKIYLLILGDNVNLTILLNFTSENDTDTKSGQKYNLPHVMNFPILPLVNWTLGKKVDMF